MFDAKMKIIQLNIDQANTIRFTNIKYYNDETIDMN